ncbi:DUF2235 domain-containing protein [Devosia sp.]|uniref:DUF2235 domain-containing protein n=1 Tax=Devosia sp. TaxID=1871048 RepID=UPI0032630D19
MKRLAVFCDGTWNRMSAEQPTNVLISAQLVLPRGDDGVAQITYYDEGVGTSYVINEWWETRLAGAFGLGLLDKIEAAYRFLIFNYEPGDEIFIFGFSRGAFTARSLAGLIRKCGIVPRASAREIRNIFAFYKDGGTHPDSDEAQRRRMAWSPDVILKEADRSWRLEHGGDPTIVANAMPLIIRYVGVWDTVGALGIPQHLLVGSLFGTGAKYQFHDTALSSTVKAARHAVATDEDRLTFGPALWSNLDALNAGSPGEKYQQLWFPGDHGSVGGGGEIRGLSNDALGWIMDGARAEGLAIDNVRLDGLRAMADPLAPLHNQTKAPDFLDRIYRRGHREGPQQESLLAESTRNRLAYEAKGRTWEPYRPATLKALWPKVEEDVS